MSGPLNQHQQKGAQPPYTPNDEAYTCYSSSHPWLPTPYTQPLHLQEPTTTTPSPCTPTSAPKTLALAASCAVHYAVNCACFGPSTRQLSTGSSVVRAQLGTRLTAPSHEASASCGGSHPHCAAEWERPAMGSQRQVGSPCALLGLSWQGFGRHTQLTAGKTHCTTTPQWHAVKIINTLGAFARWVCSPGYATPGWVWHLHSPVCRPSALTQAPTCCRHPTKAWLSTCHRGRSAHSHTVGCHSDPGHDGE